MRRTRFALTAATMATLSALALTTGCSDSSAPSSSGSSATDSSAPAGKPSAEPNEETYVEPLAAKAHIVLLSATNGELKLQFIDPANGKIVEERVVAHDTTQLSLLNSKMDVATQSYSGAQLRCAFDKNFDKLGVLQPMGENDDVVGTISPSLTAVPTGAASLTNDDPSQDNFSPEKKRSVPVYNDGRWYWLEDIGDTESFMSAASNKKPKAETASKSLLNNTTAGEDTFYFFPHSSAPQTDSRTSSVYSPDGTFGFSQGEDNYIMVGDLDNGKATRVDAPIKGDEYVGIKPAAYLSKTSYISISGLGSTELNKVTVNNGKVTVDSLITPTDGSMSDVTLSPDKKWASFLFKKGNTTAVYKIDLTKTDAPQTPKLVRDLSGDGNHLDGYNILDWQKLDA